MLEIEVLIVSSDEEQAQLLTTILGYCGIKAIVCATVKAMEGILKQEQIQVVFSGVRLPDGGFRQVQGVISASKPGTPLIVLFNRVSWRSHQESLRIGAFSSLAPPYHPQRIRQVVCDAVRSQVH